MKKNAVRITAALLTVLLMCSVLPAGAYASGLDNVVWVDDEIKEPAPFSGGVAAVTTHSGDKRYGFVNKSGKLVIATEYNLTMPGPDETRIFIDGVKKVSEYNNGYKYGYIDKTGKVVIPVIYNNIGLLSEGLMSVEKEGKEGYIDKTGKVVIPLIYNEAYDFSEGLAAVQDDNRKWGFIDKTGKLVIPYQFDSIKAFSDGFAAVEKGGLWGYIDKKGKVVIPIDRKFAGSFNHGLAIINSNGKYGLMDKNSNTVVKPIYYMVGEFSNGLARLTTDDGRVGYIDTTGKIAIPLEYEAGGFWVGDNFKNGYARVQLNGKWGMINTKGDIIIPVIYSEVGLFSEGRAKVRKGTKYGFVDESGSEVIPAIYDSSADFSNGYAAVKIGDRWGFIDKTGKLVVPAIYNEVISFRDGAAWVKKISYVGTSKWGIISTSAQSPIAVPTASKILVNGKMVSFDAYTINGSNYFKLRDLAYALNGTEKQFEVSYDAEKKAVNLVSNKAYTEVGGELAKGDGKTKSPTISAARIYKNGWELGMVGYNINGNNYFMLRDVAQEFSFGVDWDAATKTVTIETGKGYVMPE